MKQSYQDYAHRDLDSFYVHCIVQNLRHQFDQPQNSLDSYAR